MIGKGLVLFGLVFVLSLVAGLFIVVFGVEPLTHSEFYTALFQRHNIPFVGEETLGMFEPIRNYFSLVKFIFYVLLVVAIAALILTFYFKREVLKNGFRHLGLSLALPGLMIMIVVLLASQFAGNVELPDVAGIRNVFDEFVYIALRRIMIISVIVLGIGTVLVAISLYMKNSPKTEETNSETKSKKATAKKENTEEPEDENEEE